METARDRGRAGHVQENAGELESAAGRAAFPESPPAPRSGRAERGGVPEKACGVRAARVDAGSGRVRQNGFLGSRAEPRVVVQRPFAAPPAAHSAR